jgi:photosystem II stability/assembly factor-like uncharacterized protein
VTKDGGVTWTPQASSTTQQLNAVWCTSAAGTPAVAIAVGRNGTVVRSTDGGETWGAVKAGTAQSLYGVYMTDALHGWAVGKNSTILYTVDGGLTWTAQKAPQGKKMLNAVRGIPGTSNVWIVGNGGLLWATTNGSTWTNQTSSTGTTSNLYAVYYGSTSAGWIVGANGTVRYWSGTGNFQPSATTGLPSGAAISVRAVVFPDANTGYFAGDAGTLRKSADAGRDWISQQYTIYGQLNDIAFGDETRGWGPLVEAMKAIREGAGEAAHIRYCQTPPLLSVKLADSVVGGEDTLDAGVPGRFDALTTNARSLAAGYWLNDVLYHREVCDMSVRMQAVVEEAHAKGAIVKVIFETSEIGEGTIRHAVESAIASGADFVKTSTGFASGGATFEAVAIMLDQAKGRIKVKPSGGIRDFATARKYVEMGASRLGIGYNGSAAVCSGEGTSTDNY